MLYDLETFKAETEDQFEVIDAQIRALNSQLLYLNEVVKPQIKESILQYMEEYKDFQKFVLAMDKQFKINYFEQKRD